MMSDREAETHPDYVEGYRDGYDLDCPFPNANRSERYRHSFWVGRREKTGKYMRYGEIMKSLENAEKVESERSSPPKGKTP